MDITIAHEGFSFSAPTDLRISATNLRRVLVVGSCQIEWLRDLIPTLPEGCPVDFITSHNYVQLPPEPPRPAGDYDFQICQIPVRTLTPKGTYIALSAGNEASAKELFEETCLRLDWVLACVLSYNERFNLTTFVMNLIVPQQNGLGRLQNRYSYTNPVYFIEELNRRIYAYAESHKGTHVLDINGLTAILGKANIQDDVIADYSHAALLADTGFEWDQDRMHPTPSVCALYEADPGALLKAAWNEAVAMHRTLRQLDQVKLVVVDLDDTVWRGVAVESAETSGPEFTAGWPLGVVEALGILKSRGVLLAIASKNDEDKVRGIWDRAYGKILPFDAFSVVRINWGLKADNLAEIMGAVNLLPRNVVFIDDNPVERASIEAAFPDIRTLGSHPYYLRRVLLWAPETQVAVITDESAHRTEMVQAQIRREDTRHKLSHEDFIASLQLKIEVHQIRSTVDPRFTRVMELVNKSNQFNTTGKRWSRAEFEAHLEAGEIIALEVEDRFTNYGLVAVLISKGPTVEQFVMSCRVIGLGVEKAAVARHIERAKELGFDEGRGVVVPTEANWLAQDLWRQLGFVEKEGAWALKIGGDGGAGAVAGAERPRMAGADAGGC